MFQDMFEQIPQWCWWESRFGTLRRMGTTAHCWSSAIDYCSKTGRWLAFHIVHSLRSQLTLKQAKYDLQMWTERLFSMLVSQRGPAFPIILHWTANCASFLGADCGKAHVARSSPELCSRTRTRLLGLNWGLSGLLETAAFQFARSLQWTEPTGEVATPPNLGLQGGLQGSANQWAARSSWARITWPKSWDIPTKSVGQANGKGGKSVCAMFPSFLSGPQPWSRHVLTQIGHTGVLRESDWCSWRVSHPALWWQAVWRQSSVSGRNRWTLDSLLWYRVLAYM